MSLFKKIKNKYFFLKKNYLIKINNGKLNFPTNKSIVISGVPRGGTTWLAELLNTNKQSAILWEPLSLNFMTELKSLNFKERQFLAIDYSNPRTYTLFNNILEGKILTRGVLQRTSINQLKNANYLIIKFCRANRLLPWLTQNFEFSKTIHLLRHPCAVVASQLKFGAWDDVNPTFTKEELMADGFIEKYYSIIKPINTIEEKLAAIWCLDNVIPLTQNTHKRWVSITYENLLLHPEDTFRRMDLEFSDSIREKFYQASSTTKNGSPINSKEDVIAQLSYWKTKLNTKQINKIMTIVEKFEISVYNENILPTVNY
jgi:hypothetical protein